MAITIALAGNPNSGKTTLFNALTGSNQYVGNWPGVTVEKKEGRLKGNKDVIIADLPGIYSLSPYTLEEVVARNYLINNRPDAIINIVDGTNLERNLYLTTQILELGIPVVMAVNMMDLVRKNGDTIKVDTLAKKMGCEVVEISALKGDGIDKATEKAIALAKAGKTAAPLHNFSESVEKVLASIEGKLAGSAVPDAQKRFFAIKLLERDDKIIDQLSSAPNVEEEIKAIEKEMDDDTESIITNERYNYISSIISDCYKKHVSADGLTTSDKIDKIVTNRILALPIFAVIMFIVYYVSVTTVGGIATDWANDGVFGDGWYLAGIGRGEFDEADGEYGDAMAVVSAFVDNAENEELAELLDDEAEEYDGEAALAALQEFAATVDESAEVTYIVEDEETLATEEASATGAEFMDALEVLAAYGCEAPDPADYGIWIPGIPVFIESALTAVGVTDGPLYGVIMDGIVAGVGAVLGFVPQILILFIFLAFLEGCGYMARIAFIMDRIFRKFGLSGKSFIPMLIGSGCGVPGIMASRTIENDRDRKMTIITTTFVPCGAKLPFIAMVAGAVFGGAAWVAPSAYFLGIGAIIVSGIMLKKTRLFAGDPAPFVMELPAYHLPTVGSVLRSMWERGSSFIKKAGTIILLSTILVWFLTYFGFVDGAFTMLEEDQIDSSILAMLGNAISWIFIPQGWGHWQATVASITGLIAKENIVGTLGIIYNSEDASVYANMAASFTAVSGYSFLAFNLLCAPCFAAMGAIRREMNNTKWFWVAVGYQCGFAYLVSLVVNQIGNFVTGQGFGVFTIVAIAVIILFVYLLIRPYKESDTLDVKNVRSISAD
ncbi:MAG: ferrous iron transport protein B [Clostridiales bacterium]|nr:ferrous iron transport protein B [Clostridiales bacterium]